MKEIIPVSDRPVKLASNTRTRVRSQTGSKSTALGTNVCVSIMTVSAIQVKPGKGVEKRILTRLAQERTVATDKGGDNAHSSSIT
jgi:hypothetical protein